MATTGTSRSRRRTVRNSGGGFGIRNVGLGLGVGSWELPMARGWESKSVEAQQDAAADQRAAKPVVSPDDAARRTERNTLALARTRALADLQRACAAPHRAMLEQAIADLDRRIASLEDPNTQVPPPKPQS
jgi:hypothetical protein